MHRTRFVWEGELLCSLWGHHSLHIGMHMGTNLEALQISPLDFVEASWLVEAEGDCNHEIQTHLLLGRKTITNIDSIWKKQKHYFANKGQTSQSYGFSSHHVEMWESDYKESWVLKNWCFLTVVLEKTLGSLLNCKEIQPVHPKGDQSWIFIGRTNAEAKTPILWPPDAKNLLIGKDPDAGKDWRQRRRVWQRMRWLDGLLTRWAWVWAISGSWWWTGKPGVLLHGVTKSQTWLSNWTELREFIMWAWLNK